MAIVIEENGSSNRNGIFGIIGWLVFLAIAGVAVYYVFFAQPELVSIPATGSLGTIAPIAQLSLDPQSVVNSPAFQALTSTIPLPTTSTPATVSRPDPFLAP